MFLCCPALGTSRVAWLVWFLLLALTSISQPRWQKQKHRRGFLSSELPAAIQAYLSSSFSITHERFPLENSCVVSPEISIIINNNNKKKHFPKHWGWWLLDHFSAMRDKPWKRGGAVIIQGCCDKRQVMFGTGAVCVVRRGREGVGRTVREGDRQIACWW